MGNAILLVMFLFFLFHFTCSSPSTAHTSSPFLCRPHQSRALLQFKSAFTISDFSPCSGSYPKTESWKEGTDCCSSWDGVTCSEETGHVIELDLSCSQLVGNIHSNNSLFSPHFPPYLKRLNLASNDFQGSNMSSLFGVKFGSSLTHLDLSNSGFSGNIPSEISQLSNLVSLDLSYNWDLRVESDRVLERIAHNLTHLRVLVLDGVNMSSVVHASSSLMNLSSSLTSLNLQFCGLQGQFPVSLLLHLNLQVLLLSRNNFDPVTSLPVLNSITPSNNLTFLDLSFTDLSSVSIGFLDFLGNLRSLRILFLANCSLSGSSLESLGNLTKLTSLTLPANNLSGSIPDSFCNMTQLFDLDLGDNQLNGMLPSCLFAMPSLEFLRLNDNKLHGQIPTSLVKYVNLRELNLSSNNLSGSFDFHMLLGLKKLRYLDLSHNDLSSSTSTGYNFNYSLPSLRTLHLSSCNLTKFPSSLETLSNLTSLDISHNKIEGHLPILPSSTEFFSVSDNNFSGEISSLICNVTSLRVLDLSHNRFNGFIPQCLGNLSELSVLNLGTNNLHGTIPNMFTIYNFLSYLVLNENLLRGRLPHSLSYCQFLMVLDVGHNLIEDTFPHWLESLSMLEVLLLRSNKFHGSINSFKSNSVFPSLRILDAQNNNLTGKLPTTLIGNLKGMMKMNQSLERSERYMNTFSNDSYRSDSHSMILTVKGLDMEYEKILTAMMTIDFSRNKFEGDIPEVIGKLGSLKGLNLSHNLLTGHIPSSMGDLADLEWLDLSSNKLVGQIPRELTNLGFLEFLSLAHNQLEGPIPQGKQFNTFGSDSYRENLGLCGFPLSKTCKTNEEALSKKNVDSLDSASGFSWEGAFVGYGCGIVFGVYMGYLVFSRRSPQWLVRMVEQKQHHGKSVKRSKKSGRKRGGRKS